MKTDHPMWPKALFPPPGSVMNCPPALPEYAEATALLLERITKQIRDGKPPQELGYEVELIGRIMARKI